LAVPLLPGESVVSEGVDVQDATVQVVLSPTAASMSWRSKLAKGERLTLKAPESTQWVERWTLDVSPMWHVASSGIAPAHHTDPDSNWLPSWRPWPGESVVLEISRPKGIGGRTVALDSSVLDLRPGKHSTEASLKLQIRSTQGGRHVVTLPPGAQLAGVDIDGRRQPIRLEQGKVVLPIEPRTQSVALSWRQPEGMLSLWQAPQVDLGAPSVNARMLVHLGEDRWVLLLGGPRLGPAVLYWGLLGVIVLIALGLGRLKSPPLRAWHWALLGVGLSQADVVAALMVVGWLLLLGWRSSLSPERLPQRWRFDLLQVLLVLATLAALVSVVQAVEQGLLGTPEMQIAGNGSTSNLLQWYQDRTTGLYPGAYVVSVSIWVYKLLMLAWALWLSFALLRWLRWAWHCLSRDGLWQPWRRPRERAKSAEPASEGG